jgi:hypothetical protein
MTGANFAGGGFQRYLNRFCCDLLAWRAGGPVQRYIHQKLLHEFFACAFAGPLEEFFFHGGRLSGDALAQIKRALRATSRECAELIERDRLTTQHRQGAAFVLAIRPWNFSGFAQFDRELASSAPAPDTAKK